MDLTTILGNDIVRNHQKNWYIFLSIQKNLAEKHFSWLTCAIDINSKKLLGKGSISLGEKKYNIVFSYSPFHSSRYDRIFIADKSITYHKSIHLYADLSLCLYHPRIDQPLSRRILLLDIIPWITEWIIFYEQWKKYGVWFGKEIKH